MRNSRRSGSRAWRSFRGRGIAQDHNRKGKVGSQPAGPRVASISSPSPLIGRHRPDNALHFILHSPSVIYFHRLQLGSPPTAQKSMNEVEGEAFEVGVTVPPKPRTVEDILSESAVDLKKADAADALAEVFRPSQPLSTL